ncbi:hypothetical protein M9Y10_034962 [Tritrichomonas musculus]|uniref:ER membrane protein complex subunit 2 n=1 Tax=Tritrichomonas musculus TaxID=1915356 RepID=A0ABR2KID8_9EUKA
MLNDLDHFLGFPKDDLARKMLEAGTNKLSDIDSCKLGILLSMSNDENLQGEARKILVKLTAKHDRTSPYMLLKWIIQIQNGKDMNGNLEGMISDWAKQHPDDIVYSRSILWLKSRSRDNIEMIGAYVKHLETFWRDDLSWFKLGQLYDEEKLFDRASFSYEEAYGLNPERQEYLTAAARSRLNIVTESAKEKEENKNIAIKQLAKSVMMNDQDAVAWQLLINNTTNETKKNKYIAYRNLVTKTKTD